MFAGYQSSQQSNIVNNNINSSVSNSTAIASELNTNQEAGVRALNELKQSSPGGKLTVKNCKIGQDIDVSQNITQDITAISKSDISYDTNLSTNVTNDLKNDLNQEAPGFAGGFLSAQINNQLNKVSNDVNNTIRNNIFIKRNEFISSIENVEGHNLINYDEVDCEDGEIYQNQNINQDLSQKAMLSADDKVVTKNVIAVTLQNTLSNTASQGPSLFGTIVGVLFMFVMLAKAYYTTENSKSTLEKVLFIWFASYIFFAVIMWCIMLFVSDTLPGTSMVVTKFEEPWFGSYCTDGDFNERVGDHIDKCLEKATDREHWEYNWKEHSIRKNMNMPDISGTPISSSFTKDKSGKECEKGSNGLECREDAEDDYIAEMRLRTSVECSNIYDSDDNKFTTTLEDDDFYYHHDFYSNIEEDNKWVRDKSVTVDPVKLRNNQVHNDESIEILQPGTGYLTGGPYITTCRNINGEYCCKEGKTCTDGDGSNLKVYVNSLSSCSTDPDYLNSNTIPDISDDKSYGFACYKSKEPGGITGLWNSSLALNDDGNPESCPSSTLSSITKTLGYCSKAGGTTCMSADKCSINYLTNLNNKDKSQSLTPSSHVNNNGYTADGGLNLQNLGCPQKTGGEEGGCILEVNGVNKIIIDNADDDDVKNNHKFHPDNIYTIDSNPPEGLGVKKPIYHEPRFKVAWSNDIEHPPQGLGHSYSIWATSALIKTTNEETQNENWKVDTFNGEDASSESVCQIISDGTNIINKNRKWEYDDKRDMGNICESKFKLNPILVKEYNKETKEKTFRTSGGHIQLGCGAKSLSNSSSEAKCYCKNGANITKTLNSNGWLYGIGLIPFGLSFIIAVSAAFIGFNKVGKDVTGGNLDGDEISAAAEKWD
jgi:hypothetical protein